MRLWDFDGSAGNNYNDIKYLDVGSTVRDLLVNGTFALGAGAALLTLDGLGWVLYGGLVVSSPLMGVALSPIILPALGIATVASVDLVLEPLKEVRDDINDLKKYRKYKKEEKQKEQQEQKNIQEKTQIKKQVTNERTMFIVGNEQKDIMAQKYVEDYYRKKQAIVDTVKAHQDEKVKVLKSENK